MSTSRAGRGRLAQVMASRGGLAPPEAPFVIEHREALIYMLCEAAELEHGIMCQYLFAAFSLKQSTDEGLSDAELEAVTRWRRVVSHVATEEMLHLGLVHNLLSAVGAAPHFARPNFPAPAHHYPPGVNLTLVPFGEPALRHFIFLERPEGMELKGATGIDAPVEEAVPLMAEGDIVPQLQDFATVGHLYRSIEHGIAHLAERFGERGLFVGPPRAQATSANFHWPELVAVTDVQSAQRAIDTILEQGEGARGDWQSAHFGQFVEILDEYRQLRDQNPAFDPVRPVLFATVRSGERGEGVPLIGDALVAVGVQQVPLEATPLVFGLSDDARTHAVAVRRVLGGGAARTRAEHQQLGQRVRPEPVGAVDADTRRFPGRKQAGQRRGAVDIGVHAAHHVVHDRPDRNQLFHRIEILVLQAQLAHERNLGVDLLFPEMAQIQVHDVAVRRLNRTAPL